MRPLVPTAALPPIPGVRLDGVLGRGGFATVYSGTQVSLERPVAVKVYLLLFIKECLTTSTSSAT